MNFSTPEGILCENAQQEKNEIFFNGKLLRMLLVNAGSSTCVFRNRNNVSFVPPLELRNFFHIFIS